MRLEQRALKLSWFLLKNVVGRKGNRKCPLLCEMEASYNQWAFCIICTEGYRKISGWKYPKRRFPCVHL